MIQSFASFAICDLCNCCNFWQIRLKRTNSLRTRYLGFLILLRGYIKGTCFAVICLFLPHSPILLFIDDDDDDRINKIMILISESFIINHLALNISILLIPGQSICFLFWPHTGMRKWLNSHSAVRFNISMFLELLRK